MPAHDLELLREAALAAGEIALPFFKNNAKVWDKPGGAGPVTEADLAVNEMLQERLMAARPDYGWLSEENEDDPARLVAETVFIIDPIDGTRAFTEGGSTWSHALAVAHKGVVTAAAVFLPVPGKLYTAALGKGAFGPRGQMQVSSAAASEGATVLTSKPNLKPEHWKRDPGLMRHYRASLAYRLSLIAEGRFDCMLALRPSWEWDIAAGALLVAEAGGVATDRTGAPLIFNQPVPQFNGVVAAPGALHAGLIGDLK